MIKSFSYSFQFHHNNADTDAIYVAAADNNQMQRYSKQQQNGFNEFSWIYSRLISFQEKRMQVLKNFPARQKSSFESSQWKTWQKIWILTLSQHPDTLYVFVLISNMTKMEKT